MKKLNTKMLVSLAFLIALEVILSRFLSINLWNIRIGFAFIPVAISAIWFGIVPAITVAVTSDIIGAILFPSGPFFPGFTVSALLLGLTFGIFLKEKPSTLRTLIAVLINQLIIGLLINTAWLAILYGKGFIFTLGGRIIQCAILIPLQFIVISGMYPLLSKYRGRLYNEI